MFDLFRIFLQYYARLCGACASINRVEMDRSLADCNNANGPCNIAVYKRQAEEGRMKVAHNRQLAVCIAAILVLIVEGVVNDTETTDLSSGGHCHDFVR